MDITNSNKEQSDKAKNSEKDLFKIPMYVRPKEYGEILISGVFINKTFVVPTEQNFYKWKITQISTQNNLILFLSKYGCVYKYCPRYLSSQSGYLTSSHLVKIDLPGPTVKIVSGKEFSAFLLASGRVFLTGNFNIYKTSTSLDSPSGPIELLNEEYCVDISAGYTHLVILTNHGKVFAVGNNCYGQLGNSETSVISEISNKPLRIMNLKGYFQYATFIKACHYATIIKEANSKKFWFCGLNSVPQFGLNCNINERIYSPVETKMKSFISFACGDNSALLVNNDSTIQTAYCGPQQFFYKFKNSKIFAWGNGSNYQLGNCNNNIQDNPQCILDNYILLDLSCNGQFTVFLVKKLHENKRPATLI